MTEGMKSIRVALITTVLFLAVPQVSLASITCTPATCSTITQTVTGDDPSQLASVTIPSGVDNLSFYAKGGDGGSGSGSLISGILLSASGGGGGGACAYVQTPSYTYQYVLCVGGGGASS